MRVRAHPHFLFVALLAVCTGVLTGLVASSHAGPFAGLAAPAGPMAATQSLAPLNAAELYPPPAPPSPIESFIVAPNLAPLRKSTSTAAPRSSVAAAASPPPGTPTSTATATVSPTPKPRRTPCDDDCGGDN